VKLFLTVYDAITI